MANRVDVNHWKEFCVGDLFEIKLSSDDLQPKNLQGGNMPLVSSGMSNNGICMMVDESIDAEIFPASSLTVDMFGKTFYQPDDYFAVSHGRVNVLIPRIVLSEAQGLFLQSVLDSVLRGKYSYSLMCTSKKLAGEIIRLPVTLDGEPDWDYMEQYMKTVIDRQAHVIDSLTRISKEKHPVDMVAWGEFRVGDLFENYHGSRLTVAERLDGDIPFLTAGFENQGVAGYVGNVVETYHNPITVDMFGNCFYHAGNYAGDDNVYFFVNDTISEFSKLFVTSVIAKKLTGLYSYNCQFRQGDADDLCVRLPVTPGGEPDWSYMEQYMRAVMDRQEYVVRCLTRLQ